MKYVYVISQTGKPLMPTCRYRHVRWLLKQKKARVVRREPFTIQLLYETTEYIQPLVSGIDPGTCTIGITVRRENGKILFAGELCLRSRQVTEKMTERRMHRRSRRNYRRLRRIRRAEKAETRFEVKQYRILGTKNHLECKKIRPKLVRFYHRKRREGWLTPTARHLLESHQKFVEKIRNMMPIAQVFLEYANFDVHKLVNPDVEGKKYQEGRLKDYANSHEYVLQRDEYMCQLCKKTQRELHVHHVIWESQGGADVPENLLTLCKQCHDKVHKKHEVNQQVKELFQSLKKRYVHPTLLNTIMSGFYSWLCQEFATINLTYGYETKEKRRKHELAKEHYTDAYIASLNTLEKARDMLEKCEVYKFEQFRRHNRQLIHARRDRNYYEDRCDRQNKPDAHDRRDQQDRNGKKGKKSKIVAKNRHKRMGQESDSLVEYVAQQGTKCLTRLRVTKGQKMIRTKAEKYRPGDVVLKEGGDIGIVTGSGHKGYSIVLREEKNYLVLVPLPKQWHRVWCGKPMSSTAQKHGDRLCRMR